MRKSDGTPPDMERCADILVYEVRSPALARPARCVQLPDVLRAAAYWPTDQDRLPITGARPYQCRRHVKLGRVLCPGLQVFDSGLIGEGALHAVAAARQKLLQPDALLVLSFAWQKPTE